MNSEPDPRIQGFIDAVALISGRSASELEIEIRRCELLPPQEGSPSDEHHSVEISPVGEQRVSAAAVRRTADTQV